MGLEGTLRHKRAERISEDLQERAAGAPIFEAPGAAGYSGREKCL